jgi:glycerate 2-kinase
VPHLLAAPDKFRGTATATAVAAAMADAAVAATWSAQAMPVSDGGEGLLDCFGGANRYTRVTGPTGAQVDAGWRLEGRLAVIEMAAASGMALVGARNDPMTATTRGTGELVRAALDAGAAEVIVGAGGSATTDGGLGAVEVLRDYAPLDGTITVATDVRTHFVDAAATFAPQKGADVGQVRDLAERLRRLVQLYRTEFGIDVSTLPGAGAAGGLAGGLAALGASIRPGFELVAERLHLADAIRSSNLVVSGEGRLDETSLQGKVTGSLAELCKREGVRVVVVAGQVAAELTPPFPVFDLSAKFGLERAQKDAVACVRAAVSSVLSDFGR